MAQNSPHLDQELPPNLSMPPAFLAVLSEPGHLVTLSEFQDWYDNEHVPLRLNHLSTFLTGARFCAVDDKSPSWLALYDVVDLSAFQHEGYVRLRANRSEREANLVERLSTLDRRTCEVVWDSGESTKTTSLRVEAPSKFVVTHGLERTTTDDAVNWAEGAVRGMKETYGDWVRTRVFKCVDTLRTGVAVSTGLEAQKTSPFFVLHGTYMR
jgi:hypothetical protein